MSEFLSAKKRFFLSIQILYPFLRCPGVTPNTPEANLRSTKNRRGQTSSTIYIPLYLTST